MSLIFFLLLLLPFTTCGLSLDKHDEKALLKIKKQLGDPPFLSSWVAGYDFCGRSIWPPVYAACNNNGRINILTIQFVQNLDLTAPFPDAICDLTELEDLDLIGLPGLYGPIPSCVTKLVNVVYFFVTGASLSGLVPNFYNNTKMMRIDLSDNQLSGPIPSSLSTLSNLTYLNLSSNHLRGTIPPDLVHGSPSLILSHNNLTGEIPKTYESVDFAVFDVGYNNLSGDASFLFGKQKTAEFIVLAKNNFEFDFSYVEFSDELYVLDLSHNKIYGKVPDSLATASEMFYGQLDLSCNRLCGELPQGRNMQQFKAEDFADNECLCGSPLPPCSSSAPAAAPIYAPPF